MKNTRHVTLFALQASDAHSYIAEKRSSTLSCNPIPPSILKKTSEPASSLLSIVPLFSFHSIKEIQLVPFHHSCVFLSLSLFLSFSHEYNFLSKTFSISPGNLQPPNSRWHLKYTNLSRILSLSHVVSLCSSTLCSNRLWLFHHSQTLHFHIHAQGKKHHMSDGCVLGGAYPSPPALTPLARCHLLKPHPPPAPFSLEPHTETRRGKATGFAAFSSALLSQASLICTKRQLWW